MSPEMQRIELACREISVTLENGKFTKQDLEGVKMFAEALIGATQKTLRRISDQTRQSDE